MKKARKFKKIRLLAALLLTFAVFVRQNDSFAKNAENDLRAEASFKAGEAVAPDAAIEIVFSRAPAENEKIAVTIERTDVSSLFSRTENRFVYDARLIRLPPGNSNVTVYAIETNGNWKEIARFPLLVEEKRSEPSAVADGLTRTETQTSMQTKETEIEKQPQPTADREKSENSETNAETNNSRENKPEETGLETSGNATENKTETSNEKNENKPETAETPENKSETPTETEKKRAFNFLPTFTVAMKSQPFQANFPREARPSERATFNDFTLTGSLKSEAKTGAFSAESNFDFAGSTFKPETLQFASLGREAPDIDLSSYLMNFQIDKAKFSLGHTSFGSSRHLVSGFSSRGLSVNIPINKRFDVSAGIMNGTSVVGVGNFLGVGKIRHQMQGATFGIEFFPARASAMRLEITGFNAYLQALNNVSEGRIVDAERSRGLGLRLIASDNAQRFKFEAGYTLSRFFNPQDTTLDPEGNAVPLAAALRSAHYAEATYQILKDFKLTKTKSLNLNLGFRYEYVEPLFKSLGASAAADKFTHDYLVDGSLGELTFQLGHGRSSDNLRNVPSILKSLTRGRKFSLAFPLAALLGKSEKPSPFLPRLGYSIDQTRNFGAGIPTRGGFEIDLATIPDLTNTNQTFSAGWQFQKMTLEYTYNRSLADNRQKENENKDQLGWVHAVTVGANPLATLSFNAGFNFDSQRNFELAAVNRTKSLTFGANWQPFKGATAAGNFSHALAGDAARSVRNRNINYDLQFAYNFGFEKSKFKKFGAQTFVRFADTFARNRDFLSDLNARTQTRIATAGMTLNFF